MFNFPGFFGGRRFLFKPKPIFGLNRDAYRGKDHLDEGQWNDPTI